MNIVNQKYWDASYKDFDFFIADDRCTDKFKELYNKYIKQDDISSIFELGCFPGRYLAAIANIGNFKANGVDVTEELNNKFFEWLNNNVKVGEIARDNAFDYINRLKKKKKTFGLVYSFGFIEHFTNYLEVIDYHIKITEKNGYIFICTPNFNGGYQRIMHFWLDRPNYKNHVIKSMKPKEWAKFLEEKNCEVLEYGYFGNFDFWVDKMPKDPIKKVFIYGNYFLAKHNHLPNCKFYSPYCYIIAKKTE